VALDEGTAGILRRPDKIGISQDDSARPEPALSLPKGPVPMLLIGMAVLRHTPVPVRVGMTQGPLRLFLLAIGSCPDQNEGPSAILEGPCTSHNLTSAGVQ